MTYEFIVIDASILAKLFLEEHDTDQALAFFSAMEQHEIRLIAPSILLYETLALTLGHGLSGEAVMRNIDRLRGSRLVIEDLSDQVIRKAIEIAESGNPKSGFPSFYDATYHALAIVRGGVFLTSDHRHVSKTETLGHVTLLRDWKSLMETSLN